MNQPLKLNLQSTMKDVDVLMGMLFTQKQDSAFTVFDNLTDAQILATLKNKNIGLNKTSTALVLVVNYDGTLYKNSFATSENTVIETYKDGFDWYRIWSDGSIEQGGNCVVASGYGTVTLLKELSDTDYRPIITQSHGTGSVPYTSADIVAVHAQTTTTFGIICSDNEDGAVNTNVGWYVYGK